MAIGAALAFPGVTSVDRERIELAQSVPNQMPNLVDHQSPEPRHYYVDMRLIVDRVRSGEYSDPPFDEAGIPIIDYTRFGGSDVGAYNPITTAQYALGLYERHLAGEAETPEPFLQQAEWLVAIQVEDGGFYYQFDVPSRSLEAPWLSAIAQGEAMSVLLRDYYETRNERFLRAAEKAPLPLQRPLGQGGLRHVDSTGTWLEEYPEDPPSHVLNGAIFTLFGLYDLVKATGNRDAAALFEDSWTTLADNLDRYEADGWVRYQLTEDAWTTATYYGLHVEQLRALAALTGDARFDHRADTWEYPLRHRGWWLATRFGARVLESVR